MSDLPSRSAGWYSAEDLREISHAWSSGRLFDREVVDYEAARQLLNRIPGPIVDAAVEAAIGDPDE